MAGNVKGITIEFRGKEDVSFKSAINKMRNEAKSLDKELNYINKDLKFDPTNVTLWAQKQKVLTEEVNKSKERVAELQDIQRQLDEKKVDKNSAEYRELEREIEKAKRQQKDFQKELNKLGSVKLKALSEEFKKVGNNLVQAGEALKGLSTAAAGVDVAIGALAYKSGKAADELNTLASVTGISTDELQKYKAAADLVDVSVETIANSQNKMKKSMLSAQQGSKNTAEAFKTLGVNIEDSNGHLRSQDEVFTEAIAALGKMENETERDALAMQIFGRSARDLNPLIEDNGETYKKVADIFNKNELSIVDQETIDKANQFQDTIDEIKLTGMAALNSLGMQLAGYLQPALEKIAGAVEKVFTWLSKLDPEVVAIVGVIAGVIAALAPVLIIVGKLSLAISSIMSLMATIGPALGGIIAAAAPIVAGIAAVIAIGVLLYKNWDKIKEYAGIVKDWVVKKWGELKTFITNTFNAIKTTITTVWTNIKTTVVNTVTNIKNSIVTAFTTAKNTITSIFGTIKTVAEGAWAGIKFAITHPIDAAVMAVRLAISKIKGFFSNLSLKLPHIKLPHFKLTGKLSLAPPSVPKLSIDWYKNGGIFTQPTIFGGVGVGEAGAEAVLPLKKLWEEMDKRFTSPAPVTINVYAPQGMNVNQLAEEVQRRLVQLQKQKAKAY